MFVIIFPCLFIDAFFFIRRETSYYHALGSSAFAFLQAMLTFEHVRLYYVLENIQVLKVYYISTYLIFQRDIKIASQRSDQSLELSNRFRRKNSSISQSLGRMLKKADYSTYTEGAIAAFLSFKIQLDSFLT